MPTTVFHVIASDGSATWHPDKVDAARRARELHALGLTTECFAGPAVGGVGERVHLLPLPAR